MKCMRRPDRATVTRVPIAAQAFLSLGVYGEITRRAKGSRVSRWFLSTLLWPLRWFYDLDGGAPRAPEAIRQAVDRHLLVLRCEGHGARERLAHILQQWGRPCAAGGALSPRLAASAQALPRAAWSNARLVCLGCEALLTRGQPSRLTVAPRSLAILQSELGQHREAETGQQPWPTVAAAGLIEPQPVGSDHGPGVLTGGAVMGRTPPPAVFPLLRPLAMGGARFSRKALAAIARE